MEGCSNKDMGCPQLLDLIPKDGEWFLQRIEQKPHVCSEEENLELRLGPPGEEREESLEYLSNINKKREIYTLGENREFTNTTEMNGWIINNNGNQTHFSLSENPFGPSSDYMVKTQQQQQQSNSLFPMLQSNPQRIAIKAKESSHDCANKAEDLQKDADKKVFSSASANPAVPTNSSQKRTAPAPVVGWPPVRSFRKNLAGSSWSKLIPEPQDEVQNKVVSEKPDESCKKGFFVKINMNGVPIGRKVDLKAYDNYEKLSSSVDDLFRGLLADFSAGEIQYKQEGERVITGLLDGTGEYTLVYEDNEGDRMLVGDVPWHMFVSTVKRLRVLKTAELSTLRFGYKQEKIPLDAAKK